MGSVYWRLVFEQAEQGAEGKFKKKWRLFRIKTMVTFAKLDSNRNYTKV
jgi:hypothetical protein